MSFAAPVVLTANHRTDSFDCGNEALNLFLKRFALSNIAAGVARTYVTIQLDHNEVLAYYSLAAAAVDKTRLPERIAKGMPAYPIPVIVLARLAVDRTVQGQGVGQGLLRDALRRACAAADIVGVRAMLVHAKDSAAARFYRKFGFVPSPTDPLHLMLLIKDIRGHL